MTRHPLGTSDVVITRSIEAMGNFYANVTLRVADTEAIVQTLTSQRRHALVAPAIGGSTVVFDKAIEEGGSRFEESELRRVG